MHLETGQVIGNYTVVKRIGSGGMAAVYEVTHQHTGDTLALKMMHAGFEDDKDLLRRFEREAQVVSGLDHPHIVPIFEYAHYEQTPYIVMKLIRGRTLKWHLRKRTIPLAEIGVICAAVADALTYAHERGVLHRDVKPGNIMLSEDDGRPYLTDFGLARILAQGESSMSIGMTVGTPHYLAPEQASGAYEIGPTADVYALGVMLYEMVVGQVPFSGSSTHSVIHDQIYAEPPPPSQVNPEVPAEVEAVLLHALNKIPAQRHPTPNALMNAYHNAIQASGLTHLSEDRDEIAARSLRLLRDAAEPGGSTTRRQVTEAELDLGGLASDFGRFVRETITPTLGTALNTVREEIKKATPHGRTTHYTAPTEADLLQIVERRIKAQRNWRGHLSVFMVVSLLLVVGTAIGEDVVRGAIQADVTAGQLPEAEAVVAIAWATQQWELVLIFLWLGGLAAHRAYVNNLSARREHRREQRIDRLLSNTYGPDWAEVITQQTYDEVACNVRQRFNTVTGWWAHFWFFIWGNVALAVGWAASAAGFRATSEFVRIVENDPQGAEVLAQMAESPLFLPLSLAWLVILVIHMVRVVAGRKPALESELQKDLRLREQRTASKRKRKNDLVDGTPAPAVRLNSDGELTNSTIESWGERLEH